MRVELLTEITKSHLSIKLDKPTKSLKLSIFSSLIMELTPLFLKNHVFQLQYFHIVGL